MKPFSDAAEAFLGWADGHYVEHPASATRLAVSFASLGGFFGAKPVASIVAGDVQDFMAWRRKPQGDAVREVTIRHDLHALSKAFGYWISHNWARVNPVHAVQIPSDQAAVREYVLTPEDERLYFDAARAVSPALHDLGRLMVNQGCRPQELLALRIEDVDLDAGYLQIRAGKSKAAKRRLPLTAESRAILAKRVAAGGRWIFPGKAPGAPLSKLNAPHWRVLECVALCECGLRGSEHVGGTCGCEEFREVSCLRFVLYDLRHTFATRAAACGVGLSELARLLGHGNLRTLMRYVHVQQDSMDRAMQLVGGFAAAPQVGAIQ